MHAYCNALLPAHWSVRQKLNHVSLVQLRRSARDLYTHVSLWRGCVGGHHHRSLHGAWSDVRARAVHGVRTLESSMQGTVVDGTRGVGARWRHYLDPRRLTVPRRPVCALVVPVNTVVKFDDAILKFDKVQEL